MVVSAAVSSLVALTAVPYYLLLLLFLIVAKFFFDLTYRSFRLNRQLVKVDNHALAIFFYGYLLAVVLPLIATLKGLSPDWSEQIISLSISATLSILLLRLSLWIQDHLILFRFSLEAELLQRRNVAVGVVSATLTLANGLIIAGVMVGESTSYLSLIGDVLLYWLVGQVLLIIAALLYQLLTPYDFHRLIGEEKNLAAGLAMGGFCLAAGVIIQAAVWGGASFSLAELTTVLVLTGGGFLLLALSRQVADLVFLPGEKIQDEICQDRNAGVGLIVGGFYLISAFIIAAVFRMLVS